MVYESVTREALHNILTECAVTMRPVRLIKICLNETDSEVPMLTTVLSEMVSTVRIKRRVPSSYSHGAW
jgi:hypothetical protein